MLTLDHVSKSYRVGMFGGGRLPAVRDVSFEMGEGEVVSLIGESGSGKSTIGKMVLRLLTVNGGSISIDGVDIAGFKGAALRDYYRRVQGVFQDPFSSFNPIFKVDHLFSLVRDVYFHGLSEADWRERQARSLAAVNLEPGQVLSKFPHQLSGGQLQRLLIARALVLDTRFLVADEIISMLDASTRIDVLNLLGDLKARGLGILFVTHDLSLGNYISERTIILRRGAVVEMGATRKVFDEPLHPYTRMLIASVPQLHRKWPELEAALLAEHGPTRTCLYHEMYPRAPAAPGAGVSPTEPATASPTLAWVEPDHAVACYELDGEAAVA